MQCEYKDSNTKKMIKLLTVLIFVIESSCHSSSNSSDIFMVAEHADVDKPIVFVDHNRNGSDILSSSEDIKIISSVRQRDEDGYRSPETTTSFTYPVPIPEDEDQVVFIRNEENVERVEDNPRYFPQDDRSLGDDFRANPKSHTTTEGPGDIMFISGKNNEISRERGETETKPKTKSERHTETRRFNDFDTLERPKKKTVKKRLDCRHLDCNNTGASVCGERVENSNKKYRLFLNECYFRKVNCGFQFEYNRYQEVPVDKCTMVGSRSNKRPHTFEYRAFAPFNDPSTRSPKIQNNLVTIRPFFRRFMDGRQCSHACPLSCPEQYAPECAESLTGKRQVFTNHCMMDHDSCSTGNVWQKHPLSFCVGGVKADLQENRRWIHWMQKSGIVDKKGHIKLN